MFLNQIFLKDFLISNVVSNNKESQKIDIFLFSYIIYFLRRENEYFI